MRRKKTIDLLVDDSVIQERRNNWKRPASDVTKGVLAKYRSTVSSASNGAVTTPESW